MSKGIIYVMTSVVPGLIKIGKTGSKNFEDRMYQLERHGYSNVVGLKRHFAIEVDDYDGKERLLDEIFSKSKLENSELFALDIDLVVQLLSSFEGKQIYPTDKSKDDVFDEVTNKRDSSKLPEGTYSVYGLGGADATRYVLPSQEEASATSVISLQSGQQLGDLMAGQSTVSLSANGTHNLTIGLNRKVMLIKSLVIKDIPAGTGAVSVKIAPLRESICLDGSYQGEKGGATISLTKQDDGSTWKMTSEK